MENKNQFKPFDKVLVRDHYNKRWKCDFYSHKTGETGVQTIYDVYNMKNVIPYEGNEHLVGTTDEPEEEIKLEEGELIVCFDSYYLFLNNVSCVRKFIRVLNTVFETNTANWGFAIRFKDFNPYDMEETKKYILCVKNGKIVKYKHEIRKNI